MEQRLPPEGHPISVEKAKELMAGPLADACRDILKRCCIPIYWSRLDKKNPEILHNGTLTLLRTPTKLLGVTAAHVLKAYKTDFEKERIRLKLLNEVVEDLLSRVIDVSERLDLATIAIDERVLNKLGEAWALTPLTDWPLQPPQEGRGIMLAGYPGIDRLQPDCFKINWGLFTAIGVARTVTDTQITWVVEREYQVENTKIRTLPPNYDLGGVSGGPLISWFETPSYVAHHRLSGIITEHPDYEKSDFSIERLIAIREDVIREGGTIG